MHFLGLNPHRYARNVKTIHFPDKRGVFKNTVVSEGSTKFTHRPFQITVSVAVFLKRGRFVH